MSGVGKCWADLKRNEGSAFVISILVLFILTVLGMALLLTTTTEKDIAINYRTGEEAFFNADAALEYGKNVLASFAFTNGDFQLVLPPARGPGAISVPPGTINPNTAKPENPCDPATPGCRDYQYYVDQCPPFGGGICTRVFIGRVLRRPDNSLVMYDFRAPVSIPGDLDNDGTRDIQGTATVWVRRPIVGNSDYGFSDNRHDRAILTAEGTAPNAQGFDAGRPVSLRRLEMAIRLPGAGVAGDREGNVATSSDGGNAGTRFTVREGR